VYDQAMAERASGNHAAAASAFERADRLAPSAPALGNAIRSHRDVHTADHDARAATLSLRLIARYGDNARMVSFANQVIQELGPRLERVRVTCDGCEIEVDQRLSPDLEFFVEPGPHRIVAHFSNNRTRSYEFTAEAGGTESVTLEAPPEPPPATTTTGTGTAVTGATTTTGTGAATTGTTTVTGPTTTGPTTPPTTARGGLPPAVFITGAVLTAGLAGTLLWSGLDTLDGVPAYEANPTPEALADGQAREMRTNVLIGATAVVGAATLTTLFITRWGGDRVEAAPVVTGGTGMAPGLTFRGRF
jgi:hypothetical protein